MIVDKIVQKYYIINVYNVYNVKEALSKQEV